MADPWERHARPSKYDWSWENVPSRRQTRDAAIADQERQGGTTVKYSTVRQLAEAYKSGELDEPLWLDNDTTSAMAGPDDDAECVFEMHPGDVLEQALDLLGIPHEHV